MSHLNWQIFVQEAGLRITMDSPTYNSSIDEEPMEIDEVQPNSANVRTETSYYWCSYRSQLVSSVSSRQSNTFPTERQAITYLDGEEPMEIDPPALAETNFSYSFRSQHVVSSVFSRSTVTTTFPAQRQASMHLDEEEPMMVDPPALTEKAMPPKSRIDGTGDVGSGINRAAKTLQRLKVEFEMLLPHGKAMASEKVKKMTKILGPKMFVNLDLTKWFCEKNKNCGLTSTNDCSICLETINDVGRNGKAIVVTWCGHLFCKPCIEQWRKTTIQCPICRQKPTRGYLKFIYIVY